MKIKVLYEDANILAIDKPSGVLVDAISKKYPNFILAHRLDRETSGAMLLAKNKKAHETLKSQFQARTVKKIYNAIVSGFVTRDHQIINKPIGRSPSDFRRWLAGRGARGTMRDAVTEYKVLKRFTDNGINRMALHAKSIEFSALGGSASGGKNKTIKVESPLPKEFSALGGSASGGKKMFS